MGRRDLKLDEYNITKLQYRELHNFCLQYADKKRRLADLRDTYRSPRITGLPHGSGISDPTGKTSERAAILAQEIEMIEQTAVEAARVVKYPEEYQNILLSVTNDVPLHFLKLLKDSRLTKYSYDKARRIFYFSLAKKKKII